MANNFSHFSEALLLFWANFQKLRDYYSQQHGIKQLCLCLIFGQYRVESVSAVHQRTFHDLKIEVSAVNLPIYLCGKQPWDNCGHISRKFLDRLLFLTEIWQYAHGQRNRHRWVAWNRKFHVAHLHLPHWTLDSGRLSNDRQLKEQVRGVSDFIVPEAAQRAGTFSRRSESNSQLPHDSTLAPFSQSQRTNSWWP